MFDDLRSDQEPFRPCLLSAAAELSSAAAADEVLALLLEYESRLPALLHDRLHVLAATQAHVFDARVLQLLAPRVWVLHALVESPWLTVHDAEWLACWCVAHIFPVRSISDRKLNDYRYRAFHTLVGRHGLRARGLAGQLLYNEAVGGTSGGTLAREALSCLLAFDDVPAEWTARLRAVWATDELSSRRLTDYGARPAGRRRRR